MKNNESAAELLLATIYDQRVDAAYLRMRSRDQASEQDALMLRTAADAISRLSARLERATKSYEVPVTEPGARPATATLPDF